MQYNSHDTCREDEIFNDINDIIESKTFLKNTLLKKEDFFFSNFLGEIKQFLDRQSCIYVYFLIEKYNRALMELRRNNFSTANNYFSEIQSLISNDQALPNLIVTTMANNVLAYREYKNGNSDKVLSLLLNSLEIDCILEEKGFTILHFHKIQTLHNIARTYLKENLSTGISISVELIKYLSPGKENLTFNKFTFFQEKNAYSTELCSALFLQILNELIFYFIKHKNDTEIYYFEIIKRNLDAIPDKKNFVLLIIQWLDIVLNFSKNSGTENTNLIANFLKLNNEKLASLSIFLIKKFFLINPVENKLLQNIRSDMASYGIMN